MRASVSATLFQIVAAGAIFVRLALAVRRGTDIGRAACSAVFSLYIVSVVSLTVFPIELGATEAARAEGFRVADRIVLNPLDVAGGFNVEFFENVLLGVPFGIGYPFVAKRPPSVIRAVKAALALFAAIEAVQLATLLIVGFSFRVVDVRDVVANVAGAVIGFALYLALRMVRIDVTGRTGPVIRHVESVLGSSRDSRTLHKA